MKEKLFKEIIDLFNKGQVKCSFIRHLVFLHLPSSVLLQESNLHGAGATLNIY
jgi:hypothetical protein